MTTEAADTEAENRLRQFLKALTREELKRYKRIIDEELYDRDKK